MTLKIYVSPTGRLIREDLGKPAEVALADVFRHTLSTQERTDALAGVYGDEVRIRVLEIEADAPATGAVTAVAVASALSSTDAAGRAAVRSAGVISTHAGAVADQSAMLTIANVRVGDTVKRTDTGTDWRCDGLPSSTLANWRNLGVSGGAAGVQTGALAPSATLAPNADAVLLALSNKSDYHPVGAATSGVTINAEDHADRRVDIASPTAVSATWNTGHGMTVGQSGRIMQTGAGIVTLTQGTGTVRRSPNVALGALSTSGVDSWIDWEYMGGDLLTVTALGVVPVGAGAHAMPVPVADVGSASTAETVVFETTVPALSANAEVEISFGWDGTGAGNKTWRLKIGGTGTGGTLLHTAIFGALAGKIKTGFRNQNNAASQVGGNTNIPTGTGSTTTSNATSAVDTSNGIRVALVLQKATAADVVNFQGARVMVYQ